MNRLVHIEQTLLKNIADNLSYPAVEFNLLNYNSRDGLDEWVADHLSPYLESKIVNYYKTSDPAYFNRSHSRNMVFRLATGDIICNVDADNFTGENFAYYINEVMSATDGHKHMLIREKVLKSEEERNTCGRICVHRDNFYGVNGFDERLKGYGFEDTDLINRLMNAGVAPLFITADKYLRSIAHPQAFRFNEEEFSRKLYKILIRYINHYSSELIFLLQDHQLECTTLIDNQVITSLHQEPGANGGHSSGGYDLLFKNNKWLTGDWEEKNTTLQLHVKKGNGRINIVLESCAYMNKSLFYTAQEKYWCLTDRHNIENLLYVYPQIKNRIYMDENKTSKRIINQNGFGKGSVYYNHTDELITLN